MDATPIDFGLARPLARRWHAMGIDTPPTLAQTWTAIHEAAATVGTIAGVGEARIGAAIERGLSVELFERQDTLHADVEDLADVLQRGIAALLTAHVHGGASQAAARSLWREFSVARDAMMGRLAEDAEAR